MASSLWTPSRRALLVGAAGLAAAPAALATAPALLRRVEISASAQGAQVAVRLSRPVTPRSFFLTGPDRFVVDFPDTRPALGPTLAGEGPGGGSVRRYRYGPRPDGSARLVLDLEGPASLAGLAAAGRASPDLMFELAGAGGPVVLQAAARSTAVPPPRGGRRVIVLDPGHGGRDPGAIGVTGIREKDVVLDAGLQLRDALEQSGRYRVSMTRDADTFIPLPDRVRFAREQGADLFVSMHADASSNHAATGASVYTLSENGSDRARAMMTSQDWAIDTGDAPRAGVVNDILVDLAQRETTNRSAAFAQTVIGDLRGEVPLAANTHRNAGFFVLLAPDVPAVLLEMGFLTNAADERRLASERERQRIAEKLAGSIDHYFAAQGAYMARA